MRSYTCLAIVVYALYASPSLAQCNPSGSGSSLMGPDYTYLRVSSAFNAVAPNAACTAAQMWQACEGSKGVPQFTSPVCTPVSNFGGTSFRSIDVDYRSGFSPNNSQACAEFGGARITVYEKALVTSGGTLMEKQCSDFGYAALVAHEVGHSLGLADIPSACGANGDIMSQLSLSWDGLGAWVSAADCQVARTQSPSQHKDNPPDYTCSQQCYTQCVGGNCPALNSGSPLIVDLSGGGFQLSGPDNPVVFDLYANGRPVYTAWTAPNSQTGFLCIDLNGDGAINDAGELFGNHTKIVGSPFFAANGFEALAVYDQPSNGGDANGSIDASDAAYANLRIWVDANHNAKTDAGELTALGAAGITFINLAYSLQAKRDRYGNEFRYHGDGSMAIRAASRRVEIYDVFFAPAPGGL